MKEYHVTCINKPHHLSPHEHITHIGNVASQWRMTRANAISRIDGGQEAFYTVDRYAGNKMYVGVVRETGKLPYLRTHADGKWNDNLLALDECSGSCNLI